MFNSLNSVFQNVYHKVVSSNDDSDQKSDNSNESSTISHSKHPPQADLSVKSFYSKTAILRQVRPVSILKKPDDKMSNKDPDEPEILTLSSDDEDGGPKVMNPTVDFTLKNKISHKPINSKEPIIDSNIDYSTYRRYNNKYYETASFESLTTPTLVNVFVSVQCRFIRIGSYKVVPVDRLIISHRGIEMVVPPTDAAKKVVSIKLPIHGVLKVLGHLGSSMSVLFIYVTNTVAQQAREQLKMKDSNGFYFDPCSQEESQRRVTVLCERVQSEAASLIKDLLSFEVVPPSNQDNKNLNNSIEDGQSSFIMYEDILQSDAHEILIRSSPVEINSKTASKVNTPASAYDNKTLLVFPGAPGGGGITVTTDDYCCLAQDQFLNDVLIDFHFKWLHLRHLSATARERTHIFSTFFYKRLTSAPKRTRRASRGGDQSPTGASPRLNAAQIRHARVKSWTKNVDIFSKDFILIPVNERAHWFLAVICFPGLRAPVRISDGKPIDVAKAKTPLRKSNRTNEKKSVPVEDLDPDWSDRDEADADTNEFCADNSGSDSEASKDTAWLPGLGLEEKEERKEEDEPIRQPCILILDSLSGCRPRDRLVATLRDYLWAEHLARKHENRTFDSETMPGSCPKVPQQNNFSDCGLFTIQFAQSFFENPMTDYQLPVRSLERWFSQSVVAGKRASIGCLIRALMTRAKPDEPLNLPNINFGVEENDKTQNTEEIASENTVTENKEKENVVEEVERMEVDEEIRVEEGDSACVVVEETRHRDDLDGNPADQVSVVRKDAPIAIKLTTSGNNRLGVQPKQRKESKLSKTVDVDNGELDEPTPTPLPASNIRTCSGTINFLKTLVKKNSLNLLNENSKTFIVPIKPESEDSEIKTLHKTDKTETKYEKVKPKSVPTTTKPLPKQNNESGSDGFSSSSLQLLYQNYVSDSDSENDVQDDILFGSCIKRRKIFASSAKPFISSNEKNEKELSNSTEVFEV